MPFFFLSPRVPRESSARHTIEVPMRIDKFLKNSRLIKRRTIAKEACEQDRIFINGKAKTGSEVKVGDISLIQFGNAQIKAKVLVLSEHSTKEAAASMYEIVE